MCLVSPALLSRIVVSQEGCRLTVDIYRQGVPFMVSSPLPRLKHLNVRLPPLLSISTGGVPPLTRDMIPFIFLLISLQQQQPSARAPDCIPAPINTRSSFHYVRGCPSRPPPCLLTAFGTMRAWETDCPKATFGEMFFGSLSAWAPWRRIPSLTCHIFIRKLGRDRAYLMCLANGS